MHEDLCSIPIAGIVQKKKIFIYLLIYLIQVLNRKIPLQRMTNKYWDSKPFPIEQDNKHNVILDNENISLCLQVVSFLVELQIVICNNKQSWWIILDCLMVVPLIIVTIFIKWSEILWKSSMIWVFLEVGHRFPLYELSYELHWPNEYLF